MSLKVKQQRIGYDDIEFICISNHQLISVYQKLADEGDKLISPFLVLPAMFCRDIFFSHFCLFCSNFMLYPHVISLQSLSGATSSLGILALECIYRHQKTKQISTK